MLIFINPLAHSDEKQFAQALFVKHCSVCHGLHAEGAEGIPDLTDTDWLYGGSLEQIEKTIRYGRKSVMPAWLATLGEEGTKNVASYVQLLSKKNTGLNQSGNEIFSLMCSACHGPTGEGRQSVGAPNLTDTIWLYGGEEKQIFESIANGRNGIMPGHENILNDQQIKMLATYVYGLSSKK